MNTSIVPANGTIERKLYSNPFAKPFEAWKFLIQAVAHPGQVIFDPFAGQCSCPRACINLGFEFRAIEIEQHHHNLGYINLSNMIKDLSAGRATIS